MTKTTTKPVFWLETSSVVALVLVCNAFFLFLPSGLQEEEEE